MRNDQPNVWCHICVISSASSICLTDLGPCGTLNVKTTSYINSVGDTRTLRTHSLVVWQVWIFVSDCAWSVVFINGTPLVPAEAGCECRQKDDKWIRHSVPLSPYCICPHQLDFLNPDLFKFTILFFISQTLGCLCQSGNSKFPPLRRRKEWHLACDDQMSVVA